MSSLTLPAPRVDFLDPRTGKVSREWVLFFQQAFERVGGSDSETLTEVLASIADKEVELAFSDVAMAGAANALDLAGRNALEAATPNDANIAELKKEVADLRLLLESQSQGPSAELKKEIEELRQAVIFQAPDQTFELQKQVEDLRRVVEMLPDYGAALAETRKSYALDSAVVHIAGTETISGAKSFSSAVTGAKFQTATASVSAPSATATTVYTIPNAAVSMYLVAVNIGSVGDAVNYSAFAVIAADGASARICMQNNGALMTITLVGLAIKVTQSSGGTFTANATVTKIG